MCQGKMMRHIMNCELYIIFYLKLTFRIKQLLKIDVSVKNTLHKNPRKLQLNFTAKGLILKKIKKIYKKLTLISNNLNHKSKARYTKKKTVDIFKKLLYLCIEKD